MTLRGRLQGGGVRYIGGCLRLMEMNGGSQQGAWGCLGLLGAAKLHPDLPCKLMAVAKITGCWVPLDVA